MTHNCLIHQPAKGQRANLGNSSPCLRKGNTLHHTPTSQNLSSESLITLQWKKKSESRVMHSCRAIKGLPSLHPCHGEWIKWISAHNKKSSLSLCFTMIMDHWAQSLISSFVWNNFFNAKEWPKYCGTHSPTPTLLNPCKLFKPSWVVWKKDKVSSPHFFIWLIILHKCSDKATRRSLCSFSANRFWSSRELHWPSSHRKVEPPHTTTTALTAHPNGQLTHWGSNHYSLDKTSHGTSQHPSAPMTLPLSSRQEPHRQKNTPIHFQLWKTKQWRNTFKWC